MSGILQADTIRPNTELTIEGNLKIEGELSVNSLENLESIVQDLIEKNQNNAPVGTIISYGGPIESIPDEWLICDGCIYLRSEKSELFDIIGTTWGYPDMDRFNVPDLRGQFLRGIDFHHIDESGREYIDPGAEAGALDSDKRMDFAGNVVGSEVGSFQESENLNHFHNISAANESGDGGYLERSGNSGASLFNTESQGSSESRPKNAAVIYIIKSK